MGKAKGQKVGFGQVRNGFGAFTTSTKASQPWRCLNPISQKSQPSANHRFVFLDNTKNTQTRRPSKKAHPYSFTPLFPFPYSTLAGPTLAAVGLPLLSDSQEIANEGDPGAQITKGAFYHLMALMCRLMVLVT